MPKHETTGFNWGCDAKSCNKTAMVAGQDTPVGWFEGAVTTVLPGGESPSQITFVACSTGHVRTILDEGISTAKASR